MLSNIQLNVHILNVEEIVVLVLGVGKREKDKLKQLLNKYRLYYQHLPYRLLTHFLLHHR